MDEAEQDRRILKLEDRFQNVESSLQTFKIWLRVLVTLASAFNLTAAIALKYLYDEYRQAHRDAAQINLSVAAHKSALEELDKWTLQRQQLPIESVPNSSPPHPIHHNSNEGFAPLINRIHLFESKPGTPSWDLYVSDVQDLRDFAQEYVSYVEQHPNADENSIVLKAIHGAVKTTLDRADFSHEDDQNRKWHAHDGPEDFKNFLNKFNLDRAHLNPAEISCYKTEIPFWYNSLLSRPPVEISDFCRNSGINPWR